MRHKNFLTSVISVVLSLLIISTVVYAQLSPGVSPVTIVPTATGVTVLTTAMTSTLAATVFNIDTAAGNFYGFEIYNAAASGCFVQIFATTSGSVTLNSTVPNIVMGVNNGQTTGMLPLTPLLTSTTGFSAAFTTTATGATPCGTPSAATFWYK